MFLFPLVGPAALEIWGRGFRAGLGALDNREARGGRAFCPGPLSTQQLLNGLRSLLRRVGVKKKNTKKKKLVLLIVTESSFVHGRHQGEARLSYSFVFHR